MSSFTDFIKKLSDLCDSEMETKRKESEKTKDVERKEEEKKRKEEFSNLEKKIKEQQKEMENRNKMLEKKHSELKKREGKLKEDLKKRHAESLKEKERKMEEMLKQINDNKKHLEETKQQELKRMQRLESAKKSLYGKEKKFTKPGQENPGKELALQEEDDLPNINNGGSQGTNQMDILKKIQQAISNQGGESQSQDDGKEYFDKDVDPDEETDDEKGDEDYEPADPNSFHYGDEEEEEDDEDNSDLENDPELDPDFDPDADFKTDDEDIDKTEEEKLFNKSEDKYHTDATQDSQGYDEVGDEDEDGDNDKYPDADEEEETNEDLEPEAVDNNDHQDEDGDDDDDVMSKISKFLKGDLGSKVIIIRQSSTGMGDGMESEPITPSCPIRGEEEPETNMFPCCEQDEEGVNPPEETEETEDGVDNTDQDVDGEVGASSEDIDPDAEEQIKDYISNTPDLKADEFNDFISELGVSQEQAMEILFKQLKSGGESENIESSPEDNIGAEEEPEQNDQEEMSPSYESLDILEKLKKKLLEQPNDPMMGGMPGGMPGGMGGGLPGGQPPLPPEMGPGGPDAEMAGENPEDQEDAMPIELESKTEELKQSGFEVEKNNAYDYYDKIRRRLNDEESINALNNLYSEIGEDKRHITPAKYLYDRVLNAIKKKRKDLAAGGAMGQQGMGGMAGGMGGGMPPMGASNATTGGAGVDNLGGGGDVGPGNPV